MLNLSKAIWGELSGSLLSAHIANRMYKGQAPEGAAYPYIVYLIVSNSPEKTFAFKEEFEDTIIQFSLFSAASEQTEIENMYADLITLYDEATFSITDSTLVWMFRENATLVIEDHTTPSGTRKVWAYHVDYNVRTILD